MKIQPTNNPISQAQSLNASLAKTTTVKAPGSQPAVAKADTVQLSAPAQARQLKQQGQTVDQIATKLHVSIQMVNNYLGVGEQKKA